MVTRLTWPVSRFFVYVIDDNLYDNFSSDFFVCVDFSFFLAVLLCCCVAFFFK